MTRDRAAARDSGLRTVTGLTSAAAGISVLATAGLAATFAHQIPGHKALHTATSSNGSSGASATAPSSSSSTASSTTPSTGAASSQVAPPAAAPAPPATQAPVTTSGGS